MQRSNLEVCVAIIEFLANKGSQTSTNIQASIKTKVDTLNKCLDLLVEQKVLIKKVDAYNIETYTNTERGKRILEFFQIRLPLIEIHEEKASKNLRKGS